MNLSKFMTTPVPAFLAGALVLGGGAAGWFGHLGYTKWGGLHKAPERPSIVLRGVTVTPVMQEEIRIFRTAFHGSMDLTNAAMREDNDKFADEFLVRALDGYKANQPAPFSAFLIQQIEMMNALAGGVPPTPEMLDAVAELRTFQRNGL